MFYRPGKDDHGLPHDPFKACVVPRAIGWISTVSGDGKANLAPYSQFTNLTFDPPYVMFSSNQTAEGLRKDTVVNAEEYKHFVWNLATYPLREAMNITAEQFPYGIDEFERAGLTKENAQLSKVPMVQQSPVKFECSYHSTVRLPGNAPIGTVDIIIGKVEVIHVSDDVLTDGLIDVRKTQPIARCGYYQYTVVRDTFEMKIPGMSEATLNGLEGNPIKRGHPDLCIPSGQNREKTAPRRRLGTRRAPSARPSATDATTPAPQVVSHQVPEHADDSNETSAPAQSLSQPTFVGQNSLPSLVNTTPCADGSPADDMRHALGLQNTWDVYPYLERPPAHDLAKEVSLLVPAHQDVLRYSQCYQNIVWPFYPHVADAQELESLICVYLDRSSARETSGKPIFSSPITQLDIARTSLMLAVLASGVHFSDQPPYHRKTLSQEYARRAFQCARLSNFLLRPNLESIQALLVLGHVLQNNGQAEASWALLGTTIRLAQSLGLHSAQHAENLPSEVKTSRYKTCEAELANLAMDNFGNIEWGWDPYDNDPFGADLSMQSFLDL
ncbi:hypothetical protein KCU71_g2940, partial [Aureobasidium melanogenum]